MGSCQSTEASFAAVVEPSQMLVPAPVQEKAPNANDREPSVGSETAMTEHDSLPTTAATNHSHPEEDTAPVKTTSLVVDDISEATDEASSKKLETDRENAMLRQGVEKIQPGYSSGDSSGYWYYDCSLDLLEENVRSHLESEDMVLIDFRNELVADGDIGKSVVRIETPYGKPIEDIYEGVHDGKILGEGVSGIVRRVTHRATGVEYAVKCLDTGLITTAEALKQLREEISIMCQLDHPNIVRLDEVYESGNTIFLVQELCLGGDLFDRLDDQPDCHYTEAQCARLVKQMLSSIRYLHSKKIVHRDLKLENFLFSSNKPDSELKMIDFGLSKHFTKGEVLHDAVGTPYTVAPDVIRGSYDEKCDIWSLGVIAYLLLSGETPFGGCDGENLLYVKENIMRGPLLFEPEDVWENSSDLSKAFVRRALNRDPALRPTAKELQKDPWLQVWAKKDVHEGSKVDPKIVESLVRFKEYSDMRKLLYEVLSFSMLPEQIIGLRKEFEKMDTDGDGEISLMALRQVLMENAGAGALGALTEYDVREIFGALRVTKAQPSIRWHEFIAAGLSKCEVDDRNLRLAFDRLDTDRKGYISFEDISELLGHPVGGEESLRRMWFEGICECHSRTDRIAFPDFLMLMKGQPRDTDKIASGKRSAEEEKTADRSLPIVESVSADSGIQFEESKVSSTPTLDPQATSTTGTGHDTPNVVKRGHFRKRSQSFDLPSITSGNTEIESAASSRVIQRLTQKVAGGSMTPLGADTAFYRWHREMRLAVLEASKVFDIKRQARQLGPQHGAGLTMRRGEAVVNLDGPNCRMLMDAAAKRSGRTVRAREKTVSDMTGMMVMA